MVSIIQRTFKELGHEVQPSGPSYPMHMMFKIDGKGKRYSIKQLMEMADEIRVERGLEPLWRGISNSKR